VRLASGSGLTLASLHVRPVVQLFSNIQRTVRYTELAPDRFRGFWCEMIHPTANDAAAPMIVAIMLAIVGFINAAGAKGKISIHSSMK
jgi:hypothetical protein